MLSAGKEKEKRKKEKEKEGRKERKGKGRKLYSSMCPNLYSNPSTLQISFS